MARKRPHRHSCSSTSADNPSSPFSREQAVDVKLVHLDDHLAVSEQPPPIIIKCLLPPHQPLAFASLEDYHVHYHKTHVNRCSECHKNFPDEHFLLLHIAENHDPFVAARRERGDQTYACLVPTCDRLCSSALKRRLHCIDKHQFHKNFDFFIINDGIDRRTSMLRPAHRRRSSTANSMSSQPGQERRELIAGTADDAMDVVQPEKPNPTNSQQLREHRPSQLKLRGRGGFSHPQGRGRHDTVQDPAAAHPDPVEKLTSSMSALNFVPHSVRMARGRGRGRGG